MDNYLRVTYSKKYCVVFLSKISLYLFILLGMACNESANKSHVFEKEQDQYIAQTEDYQITLANNAIEILPSGAQATTTIAFAQEKKNEPIISSQKAIYKNAFEQTDIVLYKKENGDLAYDIELAPHATVEEVKLKLDNIENAYISSSGELIIPIDGGAIHHSAPVSYQEIEGERIAVESAFTLADATLGFEVGDYDPNYSLVIDPTISFVLAVTINVFEDYDNDGVDDGTGEPGVAGVTVTAFDDAGTATVLTDNGDGSYTLPGSGGPFRIEVTNIPFYLEPGAAGTTTTFFVNDGESADVALIDPKEFCADDTRIAVPCYVDGERNSIPNSVQDAVITFDINSGGAPGSNSIATYTASTNKFIEADLREIGATYGVAYQRQTSTLFMASMLKRHVDLGPDGIGAIYRTSLNSSSPSLFIDLEALGLDVGTDPRTGTTDFDEDYDAFPLVSKASFGDMDMGSDDETLWVMDLFNRQLLEIPIGPTGQAPTMLSQIGQYPVPDPGCAANGDVRPFAIEVHRGVVYVGLVCSGESTGDIADLQAHIYSFDPISKTYSTNPVFSITDLTYERGCSVTVAETACDVDMDPTRNPGQERRSAGWFTWIDDPDDFPKRGGDVGYGVPILADIEFNEDNDLILGFRDRSGDQAGWEIRHPDPNFLTGNINIALEAQGDILRAEFDGVSSWTLESNAMSGGVTTSGQNNDEGPGGGEFFVVDGSNRTYLNTNGSNTNPGHEESSHGALALKMGTQNVIFTQMNPVPLEGGSVNPNVNRDGGIRTANTEDGTLVRAFRVFDGDNNEDDFFDKGAGLGDLELVGEAAPLQVGNYIWEDTDGDGIQDPSESGIAGVTVELWADTDGDGIADTKVAETTTDANGQYLFSEAGTNAYGQNEDWSFFNGDDDEVDYNTAYEIRIPTAQSALTDLNITTQNTGGVADNNNLSDLSDSDAMEDGANAVIAFTTGGPGENNPTLDAGFRPEQPLGSIGNYVWIDEDSDGFQDEGEVGIPNVAVVLKDGNGNPIDTTYTDSDGGYLFTDLSAGDYFVDVLDGEDGTTNTLPNSALSQTTINTNVVDGSDADTVDDDGDLGNKDHSGNGYAITLDPGEENLTADFGYNYNPTADVNDPSTGADNTAALGDRVWIDSDGDGVQDPNEVGVSGVQITLTGAGPDGIFGTADDITATTTTDENGYYLFDNLTPGAYTTEVTSSDPAVTGVPVSHDILNTTNYAQTGDPDDFGDLATMPDNQQTQPIVLGPGDVYLNSDYGYQPTAANMELGSIGNTIWLDADADGNGPADGDPDSSDGANGIGMAADADNDEEPIAGVSVSLIQDTNGDGIWTPLGADGIAGTADDEPIVATDVTDENGNYLFEDLPLNNAGDGDDTDSDYIVWVNDTDNVLDGLESTFDEDSGIADQPDATGVGDDASMVGGMSAVTLDNANPDNRDQDFGYTPAGNTAGDGFIGNYVWFDQDGDDAGGQADAEADMDSGIEGVVMELNVVYEVIDGLIDVNGDGVVDANDNGFIDGIAIIEGRPDINGDGNTNGDDDGTILGVAVINGRLDTDGNGLVNAANRPDDDGFLFETIATTTTDENGFYLFGGLPVDGVDYQVQVADSNFATGGVLEGLESTFEPDGNNDNLGEVVSLTTAMPGNLDQDFGYTGDDAGTLGSIGSTIWEDTDNDGVYEPNGTDGVMGTDDDETPLAGVTVNLIRDLNGNGQIDPGEPVIGTETTDADGNYLFDNLPMGDYIVDVTDEDDVLAGYFSSPSPVDPNTGMVNENTNTTGISGSDNETADDAMGTVGGDQSKPDAFAVTLDDDDGTPDVVNNLNVDFGYYKEPAAVGNYVWIDENGNGLQDDGETGLNGVEVTLNIEYPDGTTVTLVTTTMNDANGNPGFYEFPNLLLDEDYNTGATADPAAEGQPLYTISVDPNQTILTDNGFVPTMTDVNANDLEDSDDFAGVVAIPFQGSEDTAAQDPETDENPIASYDFGVAPSLSIGSTVFSDAENDGLLNNADAGIDGVSVNLNQVFGVDANGNVDINNDGIFDANDDGFLDGFPVIDGQIDFNRDGVVDMDDDGTITGMDGDLTVVDGQLSGVPAGADQTFQIDMQTTSGGGNYFFDGLYPGDYQVEIPASNFDMGTGALAGTPISSTPTVETDDGAANIDNDDNGIQAGGSGTATVSPIITLSAGDEPTDGGTETGQANDQDDGVDANGDMTIDFGFVAPINDLATTIVLVPNSDTNGDGQYDVGETADFTFTVFNQGTTPASDVTITNYVPSQLTPSPDGTSGITNIVVLDINGTPRVVPVTVTKVGNDYVIDFGDDPDNWLQPGEQISFDVEYIINEGNATDNIGDPIINIIEISEFDVNNDGTGDTDVDSTPDAIDDNNFGENPRDNNNDNVIDEDALTNPTTDDEDDHDFAEITADIVLPVELLDFKARASKDHIHLTWSTATETNNSHFELERSEDGKTFKQITRIQGQGTTLEQTDYNYSDREAIPNVLYYYRLKQVDLDGVFEYSEVRTAQLEAEAGNLSIYPNPIGQEQMLQVRFFAKERVANFQIIDIHGRIVLSIKEDLNATGWNTISIDIANLPTGTYLLLDASGNTQRFIKNLE